MKLRDTLSATLLAHADAPRGWKTPLSPDPAKAYPIWLLAVRSLLWAMLFTGLCWLWLHNSYGQWVIVWWPFWMVVSIAVVWGGMTLLAWNRRAVRQQAASAAGQLMPELERLPVWARFTLVPIYYLLFFVLTPLVLALSVANTIYRAEWSSYRAELVSRGVELDIVRMAPKPVPDADNFATTPLFKDLGFSSEALRSPASSNAQHRLRSLDLPRENQPNSPLWQSQNRISLAGFRAAFTNAAVFPQSPGNSSDAAAVLNGLKGMEKELEEIETASTRPAMAFPVRYQDLFGALLPHLAPVKSLSSTYRVRATARIHASDPAGALQDVKTGWRLGKISESERFLISYLVGIAIDAQTMQPIWEGLQAKVWNDAQLAELDSLLAPRDYPALCRRAVDFERAGSTTMMELWVRDSAALGKSARMLDGVEGADGVGLLQMTTVLQSRFFILQNLISLNQWYDQLLPLDGGSPDFRVAQQAVSSLLGKPRHPAIRLVRPLFPAIGGIFQKAATAETHQALSRTAIALERHALATGKYPDSLSALTPKFLPAALNDPFSKAPFHYAKTSDGRFLLYSVGPNGRDDQGRSGKKKEKDIARIAATENPQTPATATADDIAWTYLPLAQ